MEVDRDLLELDDHSVRVEATKLRNVIRDFIDGHADLDDLISVLPEKEELLAYWEKGGTDEEDGIEPEDLGVIEEEFEEEKVYKPDWWRIIFVSAGTVGLILGCGFNYLKNAGIWDAPPALTVLSMLFFAAGLIYIMWRQKW